MALREKLEQRSAPYLESGEEVRHVFLAQGGPSPYWNFLTYFVLFWIRYRIVVVTDRAIIILNAGKLTPTKPLSEGRAFLARLPRQTVIGPVSGLWGKTTFAGEKLYVHKRFHKDVNAADAEIGAARA
jgi:hypothetical protein